MQLSSLKNDNKEYVLKPSFLMKLQETTIGYLISTFRRSILHHKKVSHSSNKMKSSARHDTNKTDMPRLLNSNRFRI